jgi:hypothetical protein
MGSRRSFLTQVALAAPVAGLCQAAPGTAACGTTQASVSLTGVWNFRLDSHPTFQEVTVPHTWQIAADSAAFYGAGWYERVFDVPQEWDGAVVRMEFEAVFHSATVWINDRPAGQHLRKGYNAFPCASASTTVSMNTCSRAAIRAIGRTMAESTGP